jgi:hypothetical protein
MLAWLGLVLAPVAGRAGEPVRALTPSLAARERLPAGHDEPSLRIAAGDPSVRSPADLRTLVTRSIMAWTKAIDLKVTSRGPAYRSVTLVLKFRSRR